MTRNKFPQKKYPCMILCAGTSKRFGRNKMLADLAGKPLLQHTIERVTNQVSDLAINGDPIEYSGFDLPVFPDAIGGKLGPLAGILTAMQWAALKGRKRVLTLSGDTPFVPNDWAVKLSDTPDNRIALPQIDGRSHQVCGLWPSDLAPDLRRFLQDGGSYKVRDFLAFHKVQMVEFAKTADQDPFFNINTEADMDTARQILA
ncbi:MAG: molybdenum cofactor guanylyltransferase MobA [Robiginitomaculum sp.]|nr:MAG: molybdenum cofactor guanylyltransferase MobA [Robiginitomaculum sp.]